MIRKITIAVLAAALTGAVLVLPAAAKNGPEAVAAKKAKKCKKAKKGKKRKGCKHGSSSPTGLPGQATPASPTQPGGSPGAPAMHVSALSVAANPVLAPNPTTGNVVVDAVAPSGGQVVDLQSSASRASVPPNVVVPAGQTHASFPITTVTGDPGSATLTASIGASQATTQVSVVDTASVSSVKLEHQCFPSFGPFSSNRVSLDVPAPADTLVGLSSDSAALTVPTGVTVPSGSSSAFFSVNAVSASSAVIVTATLGSSQAIDTASVSASQPAADANGLTLDPDTVIAGSGLQGTVTLDCEAPAGGTPVTFSSADPGVGVPLSGDVTVPAGQLSVDFPITTDSGLPDGQYDISATAGGNTVHATLTLDSSLPT